MSLNNSSQFVDKFKKFYRINKFKNFNVQVVNNSNLKEIFEYLGQLLLEPQHTVKVVQYFRCELLNILWNAIDFDEELDSSSYSQHIKVCIALSKIIEIRPDAKSFIIKYFQRYPAPFDQDGEILPSKKKFKPNENANFSFTDLDVVSSSHTLLLSCTDFFKSRWSWASFISKYKNLKNEMAIWKYCDCIRIVTGMNELPFNSLLKKKLTDEAITNCIIDYESRDTKVYDKVVDNCLESDVALDVSDSVVCVGGIYLPIHKKSDVAEKKINFLSVDSTKRNLRKVALGVVSNKAVCLQGPVGSGKTFLVEYMATMTGRTLGENFIKVQLSDQTDSKMLLGTYRCTDIPGEFVWQPGVLTQAVMEGHWLLLEDIDLANMDIASVLTALLENRFLTVPGYRDSLPIAPGFQLFLTQRLISTITGLHKKQSNVVALLEKNILQINIDPLTMTELVSIIQAIYPKLTTIATRMVDIFNLFSTKESSKSGRLISSRDLFKWCARSEIKYDVTSQNCALNVLQNAIDVFCCAYSSNEDRLQLSCEISSRLGIIDEKADYYLNRYKPEMSLTADSLTSSRISLKKVKCVANRRMKYCFTRPSACLLERVMCCVNMKEPALLVGETGTGKTLAVQYLAHILGVKLIVINMNQQSDSADLLGGFKPVDLKFVISPIKNEFVELFSAYFNVAQNQKYLNNLSICFKDQKWNLLIKLMKKSYQSAINHLTSDNREETGQKRKKKDSESRTKKQIAKAQFIERWSNIGVKLQKLEAQLKHKSSLAFSFIEGSLVKAVENGYWVLLDEINLANAETLECLSGLLEGNQGSICLLERGDKAPIKRHPQFTLFACMNPSTDVGKRDLPTGLRNRFTELYMDELTDRDDLILLVNDYLAAMCLPSEKLQNIVNFYRTIKKEAKNRLCDGVGQKPHFSLRTLCRALTIAAKNPCGVFIRSLYEAFCLSFLTQLDNTSYDIVKGLINKFILGIAKNSKGILEQPIAKPQVAMGSSEDYLEFEGYWVTVGQLESSVPNDYILTNSVRRNLRDLVRVVAIGKANVLLQGDTSVGKTSLINYLAKSSGNKCVRINNHEHTDLQEYIGSYMADSQGKLVFREGVLVQAMRNGHWIILDELNLAPTDVLEALNRVLDDNRELFIPETQEIVQAHPNFMVFATQNPPGLYGGRKILSRAFRNRFVELHFNEIPPPELENILHMRCKLPPTYAKKMVAVMVDLQMRRKGSAAFAGKQGFITLRDLFRWGERYRLAQDTKSFYDWDQHIADEGYLLLAGRVRNVNERQEIAEALKKHMRRDVLPQNLFTLTEKTSTVTRHILESFEKNKNSYKNIVWTFNMRQLGVLVGKSLEFNEPVLLVGETGGGKTTICKLLAEIHDQNLFTVNCHMHTESSDFIGGLRPVREHSNEDLNRLFEWVDGPLIKAMVQGDVFLADEISLADDSVLERLNSLLEPERALLLAEKGSSDLDDTQLIVAHNSFHFVGTMNPGGDHGKKELSPALRNRFTEIWCESCTDTNDLIEIIENNIGSGIGLSNQEDGCSGIGKSIMTFIEWFKLTPIGKRFTISIRDILTWVNFINTCNKIDIADAYLHGACLTFLDSFGSGVTSTESTLALNTFKTKCMNFLIQQLKKLNLEPKTLEINNWNVKTTEASFGIEPFHLAFGQKETESNNFTYNAPTCTFNTLRLLRALQLSKAILLEGSPGVGKTSMVSALAKSTHNHLLRINLSDQTDISDLFGADLPVEGGKGGQFAWRDGAFLQALKKGHWILLDELNLASQSVLEGLNACLDHRGEVFIPELSKTFYVKPGTRLFATQNPLKQGGSRRGLPQSFLNRFTQVYIDPFEETDLLYILTAQFPSLPQSTIQVMVEFNKKVVNELDKHSFGHRGAPWEFNLRDLTRWCEAVIDENVGSNKLENLVQLMYIDRMRTSVDKIKMQEIFEEVFSSKIAGDAPVAYVTKSKIYLGDVIIEREVSGVNLSVYKHEQGCLLLRTQLPILRSLAYCVNFNWLTILVGSTGSGKSSVVRTLANLVGKTLHTLPVTSAMDTTDILGGFEQVDYTRHMEELIKETEHIVLEIVQNSILANNFSEGTRVLRTWERFSNLQTKELENATMHEETQYFIRKMQNLQTIWNLLRETSTKFYDKILILEEKGENVIRIVKEEDNLNAGGKFEWVDSKLIKCLQEGSWLLIENVNLCSPAVLDRLNALLEPNGVLTIGERGVNENGEMVEIKPHANFRLFLTMDPKNGEISRAMRNRGVEIYMLSDTEQGDTNLLDLKSLISEAGLEDNDLINVLLRMHNYFSDVILGEKPNINNLMQASFLIAQELCRGRNKFGAFYDALVDVYYKTRSSNEFDCGFSLESLKKELQNIFSLMECQAGALQLYEPNVTLKTYELNKQSEMELIKQQSTLLQKSTDNSQLLYTLVNHYTLSTYHDCKIRHLYCEKLLKSISGYEQLREVNKHLCFLIFNLGQITDTEVSYDLHWLHDFSSTEEINSNANKIFLLLCFAYIKKLNTMKANIKNKGRMTVLEFFTGVKDKKVEPKLDDVLETYLLILLKKYDSFLKDTLNSKDVNINDRDVVAILSFLKWRFILDDLLSVNVNAMNLQQYRTMLTNLHVHFKWFHKYSIKKLFEILKIEKYPFEKYLTIINSSYLHKLVILKRMSRRYQKLSEAPPPLINNTQIATFSNYVDISEQLNVYSERNNFSRLLKVLLQETELRPKLIDFKIKLDYEFCDTPDGLDDFINITKQLQSDDIINVKDLYYIELLPIIDYVARLGILKIKSNINENKNHKMLTEILTVPVDLVGVLEQYKRTSDPRLVHELMSNFFYYLLNSASINPFKFTNFDADEVENKKDVMSQFAPILSTLVTNLLVTDEESNTVLRFTKYGNYRDMMNQHRILNLLVWKNLRQICNGQYDFVQCEIQYLLQDYTVFIQQVSKVLNLEELSENAVELTSTCIHKIEEIYSGSTEGQMKKEDYAFIILLGKCVLQLKKLNDLNNLDDNLRTISNVYILLNYLKIIFNSKLPLIDPLLKVAFKKKYAEDEIKDFSSAVEYYQQQNEIFSGSQKTLHAYVAILNEKIEVLNAKLEELGKYIAVRPSDVIYTSIINTIMHHFGIVLHPNIILKSFSDFENHYDSIQEAINTSTSIDLKTVEAFGRLCKQNVAGYEKLVTILSSHRHQYPDVIEPLLNSVVQFSYGFKIRTDLHNKILMKYRNMQHKIDLGVKLINIIKFPSLDDTQNSFIGIIKSYTDEKLQNFIALNIREQQTCKQENFRLLKCGLYELTNGLLLVGQNYRKLDASLFKAFDSLLTVFIGAWKTQQEEIERKKKEDEQLYKIVPKSETKVLEEEFQDIFPNFHKTDFADMYTTTSLDDDIETPFTPSYVGVITQDDVRFVSAVHERLMALYTKSEWLNPAKKSVGYDFATPLLYKYKIFKCLLNKYGNQLDYTMDVELLNSLNVLVAVAQHFGDVSSLDKQIVDVSKALKKEAYNFYKDSNVDEVKGSFHILEELRIKIEELLLEWPDTPSLKTIQLIIDRIYGFDITSPLSKFLTGFEILLTKCHEWHTNAPTRLGLADFTANLVQQIKSWRQLEMSMWKNSLNNAYDRMNEPLQKWWFYLHEVMTQFINERSSDSAENLISTLQKFFTESNLAEYSGRLNLLFTFHCHALHLQKSDRTDQFVNILWNIHEYFKQFLPNIEKKIKELRLPIEKKVKGYIKIIKWKEISYFAVMEAIDKTHKALHRHIKEFQDVLSQSATPCLVNFTSESTKSVGIWDQPQEVLSKKYTLELDFYLARQSLTKNLEVSDSEVVQNDDSILTKSEKYFEKSKILCKKTILATNYSTLIQSLDDLITCAIENSNRLQSLEVDQTLPVNKKKSQAKSFLQQKRKALSDLFKTLTEIGLSFHTGIMYSKIKQHSEQFLMKPIELNATINHLNKSQSNEKLLQIWQGCETYYLKSLMRLDILETNLTNPSKDLGSQNVERCRGFSEHLMKTIMDQKTKLTETTRILYYLKYYSNCISMHCTETSFISFEDYETIKEVLRNVLIVTEQYKIIVYTYPHESNFGSELHSIPTLHCDNANTEENWTASITKINSVVNLTEKLISRITNLDQSLPRTDFQLAVPLYIPVPDISSVIEEIRLISSNLTDLISSFGTPKMTNSLVWLKRELVKVSDFINKENTEDVPDTEDFKKHSENFLESTLLVVQNIYKKYKDVSPVADDSEEEDLKENHLKTLVLESLFDDISVLEMNKIFKDLHALIGKFYAFKSSFKRTTSKILPCLQQLILLYEYFVTQQVSAYRVSCKMNSVLLNIFIDLSTKGFCIPPEFSDELGSDDHGQNLSSGMGLGDGEGEKDVSDKIESEDQLEDAHPRDQEKEKEEDKDCKEEDNAIEMSEDFESKLQDVEKGKDDDDENQDKSDDDDANEQMGETEKGADQLDKEIWGSDNEEEEEEEKEKPEEKGSKGEKQGENELAAKEQESKDEEKEDPSGKDNKLENQKEINEMQEQDMDDDQVDPYHNDYPEYPEPEDLDLPEDLDVDDTKGQEEQEDETNPFDIDAMKENQETQEPDDKNDKDEEPSEENDKDKEDLDDSASDSESVGQTNEERENMEMDGEQEDSSKRDDEINDQEGTEKGEENQNDDIGETEQSGLDPTPKNEDNIQGMDVNNAESADNVQSNPSENQKPNQSSEDPCQEDNPDKKGVGQSKMEESTSGHDGDASVQQDASNNQNENENKMKRKPGESDSKRSLGDTTEPVKKKFKAMDIQEEEMEVDDNEDRQKQDADAYQHIKEAKSTDHQVLDTASKEQADEQKEVPNFMEEEGEKANDSEDVVPEDEQEESMDTNETVKQKAEKVESEKKKNSEKGHPEGDMLENLQDINVEGEIVQTLTAAQGETTHHTAYSNMSNVAVPQLTIHELNQIRADVQQQLSIWNEVPNSSEAEQAWGKISALTTSLAQNLSEQLRMVLEPTQASHLKGDFRTGRRINMRKIIPYIASQFRKDKIWLRRTKPSKREYKIALAIDDSASMSYNNSKELAFESIALISKALTLLESGQLSVLSFGENTEVLHKLTDTFTDKSGVKLMQKLNFNQTKTDVGNLVEFASEMLNSSPTSSNAAIAKLLILVGDGRGIFSEDKNQVLAAIRRAKLANIFMVFVIVDNPANKHSILEQKKAIFTLDAKNKQNINLVSYMDQFPFPFYIVLRDINTLPSVLSDALRQWFEIVTNSD